MCVYIYIYWCVCIYIYWCVYIYIYIGVCVYIYIAIGVCVYIYIVWWGGRGVGLGGRILGVCQKEAVCFCVVVDRGRRVCRSEWGTWY